MNIYKKPLAIVIAGIVLASCNNSQKNESNSDNPFFKASSLAYQAPDFGKIKTGDFMPAFEEGMKQQLQEIDSIVNNAQAPNFENTFVPLEKSGQLLARVNNVFDLLTAANTDPELQKIEEDISPKLAAHHDAIYLNQKLFNRISAVYESVENGKLDAESKKLVDVYYENFILAGAKLSDKDKVEMKKLNEEKASLGTKFTNLLLAATKVATLKVDSATALNGLSEAELKAAEDSKTGSKYAIVLQNTTQQPYLSQLTNRDTRKSLFDASYNRTERGDANDTRSTLIRLAEIRAQQAKLLGFKNYAAWNLKNQMAQTPEAVDSFLKGIVPAATAKAKAEGAEIQSLIDQQKGGFKLEAWDWNFYAEQVRKAKYDLNDNEIKPYFELNKVLQNGVFYAATQLYGITFKERRDLPVYQKDVKVYEVFEKNGTPIGLFYADYFKRDNKSGGAWMSNLVGQSTLLGTNPIIYNVCNFTKPAAGEPALVSFDDVTTMFHEFGHALHGFFASQKYPTLSGTDVARDFVEFPSQFNEHWAMEPTVFKNYAVHYKTGEPMPATLVEKIKKSATFNQGYMLTELLAAASLDMQWHSISSDIKITDANKFENDALQRTGLLLSEVPPRYRSSYFKHIWGGGYAAGYYAYLWTEMLDHDAYSWFEENGGMSAKNGQRFRDMILSRGNTLDYNKMFLDFRGHKPDIRPMLRNRGLIK
ncbi:peptidyl-dipeptidase Dcp [Pedobacter arcticus]|uniref:peptidyl-dipeptidase Dcp n=1 Tax=Pedobacter arcticus TaxID=752140 RepID=UPI0002E8DACB|nr:peptidyl-dipeptidase Dcp [Pedobacter arcticus]